MIRYHIRVSGIVQGLGYRWFVRDRANRLGLSGWVRNLYDGSVEMEAEGEEAVLKHFMECIEHEHPIAKVEKLEFKTTALQGALQTFDIR